MEARMADMEIMVKAAAAAAAAAGRAEAEAEAERAMEAQRMKRGYLIQARPEDFRIIFKMFSLTRTFPAFHVFLGGDAAFGPGPIMMRKMIRIRPLSWTSNARHGWEECPIK